MVSRWEPLHVEAERLEAETEAIREHVQIQHDRPAEGLLHSVGMSANATGLTTRIDRQQPQDHGETNATQWDNSSTDNAPEL